MNKRFEKIHIIICLLAAVIVDIFCIVYGVSLIDMAIRLIATIIVFYIIGDFAKYFIVKKIFTVQDEAAQSEKELQFEDSEEELFDSDDLSEDENEED